MIILVSGAHLDHHSLEWESANRVRVKDLFFVMASHMKAADGTVSSFGRWVLNLDASVNGILDKIEVEVPAVF